MIDPYLHCPFCNTLIHFCTPSCLFFQADAIEFEPNETYAINVIVSTGEGKAKEVR